MEEGTHILYRNDVFPPSRHVVGREKERADYLNYLDKRRIPPLLGAPGCGLKSMAAYIGAHYQEQGYQPFWFTFRGVEREQAEDLLWRSSVLLANQDMMDFQAFLEEDLRFARPYPMGFKLAYWLQELRASKTLLVFNCTRVKELTPFFESLLNEIGEQFRYGTETQARVVLVARNLPFDLTPSGLPELGGLDLEGCRVFFDRLGLQLDENLLLQLFDYTAGYPRFLRAYAEMAFAYRNKGLPWPEPSKLLDHQGLRMYIHSMYDLEAQGAPDVRLLQALSILREPIDHHDFRVQVLPERRMGDGYTLTKLVLQHRVLTGDFGGAISLHPMVRDVIAEELRVAGVPLFRKLHSRAALYYESKGCKSLVDYHRAQLST